MHAFQEKRRDDPYILSQLIIMINKFFLDQTKGIFLNSELHGIFIAAGSWLIANGVAPVAKDSVNGIAYRIIGANWPPGIELIFFILSGTKSVRQVAE